MRAPCLCPLALVSLALFAGCTTLPDARQPRAVYVDLRKAVELSEDTGWVIDRLQLEANLERALRTTCQAEDEVLDALDAWIDARIEAGGGAAELQYLAGVELSDLDEVMTLERTRALIAEARTRRGDCPFWLPPDAGFEGVENNEGRTTVWLESQGFGAVIKRGGDSALSGGGGARLLVSRGVTPHLSLAVGGEVGGSGTLDPGDASGALDTAIHVGVPLVARLSDVSRIFDITVAPVFRFDQDRSAVPPGVRATLGAGFSTVRRGSFMPYVVLWLGYEGHGLVSNDPVIHSLRIGTRVGVDWDPAAK